MDPVKPSRKIGLFFGLLHKVIKTAILAITAVIANMAVLEQSKYLRWQFSGFKMPEKSHFYLPKMAVNQ